MSLVESTVQQFNTKRNGVWFHENDGYYFKQCGSKNNKVILKCVKRTCRVKAVVKNDKIIKINQHVHIHEPDFEKRCQIEEKNISLDQLQSRKKTYPKKIQEIFRSNKFVGPIEEFSTERRGIWYHQHDGYYYRKYQRHPPKLYVECIQQNCNVTAVMNENLSGSIFIANSRIHNHPPDKDKKVVVLVRKEILSRCKNEDTPLKEIYDSAMAKVDDRIGIRIPYSMFRNAMSKNRQMKNPASPDSLTKFKEMIHDRMEHFSINGGEFLSFVSENFAVFISPATRALLEDNQLIFCVDSLKCVPKKPAVSHVLIVGAIVDDVLFPIIYILLMLQSYDVYREVFNSIKQKEPSWKPKTVICEFEKGLNEILMKIFPNAVVAGSWYNYSQAVLQKSFKLILSQSIRDDANVKEIIRMLMAIPLLPANLIKEGLRVIEENAINNRLHLIGGVMSLFSYMRNQWIFRAGINLYFMSKTVLRAIKIQEDFHDNVASFFGHMHTHPNIWTFVDVLKNIEHDFASKFASPRDGQISLQQTYRKKILNARSRLINDNLSVLEFLQEICQLTPQIFSVEENNCDIDVVFVNINESDGVDEITDVDESESIELNYDWDYDDDDGGSGDDTIKEGDDAIDEIMRVDVD